MREMPVRPPARRRQPWISSPQFRTLLVWLLLMLGIVGLGFRLARLQLVQGPTLYALSQNQHTVPAPPQAARYPIIDRQGNVLAVDQAAYTLYGHPLLFSESRQAIAAALSPLLDQPEADLLKAFSSQETGIKLAVDLPQSVADRITQLYFDGLELIDVQRRVYPQQSVLAQVVGYVDHDGTPQAGVELSLAEALEAPERLPTTLTEPPQAEDLDPGMNPELEVPAEAPSEPVPTTLTATLETSAESEAETALPPRDLRLQLTLDSRLQRVTQQHLRQKMQEFNALRGTVIVMDAQDGALLTLASEPTYDPNRYYEADVAHFRNWAVSDLYEPGSTFKPLNVAIALEAGVAQATDSLYDEGRIHVGGWPIQNADFTSRGGRGSLTLTEVMKHSSNVAMVHLMNRLDPQVYYDWLKKCGLGEPTGTDLPAETIAQLKSKEEFTRSRIEPATASFGQGLSLTPLQMMQIQGLIASGGKRLVPHVVKGLVDGDGTLQWQPQRPAPEQIFSPDTAQAVLDMMEAVITDGTGQIAQISGYRIGGKTGTAQKVTDWGTYGDGRITSFVGIVPMSAPRYVVLAVIDDPQGDNAYGSTVAAPLVKSVIESLVVLEGIPPEPGA